MKINNRKKSSLVLGGGLIGLEGFVAAVVPVPVQGLPFWGRRRPVSLEESALKNKDIPTLDYAFPWLA